jgi:hypothetical protein
MRSQGRYTWDLEIKDTSSLPYIQSHEYGSSTVKRKKGRDTRYTPAPKRRCCEKGTSVAARLGDPSLWQIIWRFADVDILVPLDRHTHTHTHSHTHTQNVCRVRSGLGFLVHSGPRKQRVCGAASRQTGMAQCSLPLPYCCITSPAAAVDTSERKQDSCADRIRDVQWEGPGPGAGAIPISASAVPRPWGMQHH